MTLDANKNLALVNAGQSFIISSINTDDEEMKDFLFTLGCYPGETVTLVSIVSNTRVIAVKDARYSINEDFARVIIVE